MLKPEREFPWWIPSMGISIRGFSAVNVEVKSINNHGLLFSEVCLKIFKKIYIQIFLIWFLFATRPSLRLSLFLLILRSFFYFAYFRLFSLAFPGTTGSYRVLRDLHQNCSEIQKITSYIPVYIHFHIHIQKNYKVPWA